MLKLFEVTGFKNFKETVRMDFSDVRDYKFNSHCVTDNLISKAIIYGKNAVGKSNFGLALFDVVSHLSSKNVSPNMYDYYLNAANLKDYAEFRYVILCSRIPMHNAPERDTDQLISLIKSQ